MQAGDSLKIRRGVDRSRTADRGQHPAIAAAVGIGVAARKVEAFFDGDAANGASFCGTEHCVAEDFASVAAAAFFEARGADGDTSRDAASGQAKSECDGGAMSQGRQRPCHEHDGVAQRAMPRGLRKGIRQKRQRLARRFPEDDAPRLNS